MKEKERDTLDDLFRSKLYDFEAEPMPGDWEAIADRLSEKRSVPFRRTLRYWAAAAVVSLLVMTGGVYLFNDSWEQLPVAEVIQHDVEAVENRLAERSESSEASATTQLTPNRIAVATYTPVHRADKRTVAQEARTNDAAVMLFSEKTKEIKEPVKAEETKEIEEVRTDETVALTEARPLLAAVMPEEKEGKKTPSKRWSFGMGGGSVSAGTSNSLNGYALKSSVLMGEELSQLNSPYFNSQSSKTNIRHKTPVSLGLGIGYSLNDRFSLQSGLNYTFLSSEWDTEGVYRGETKQKLHFIGLPFSLSYKIAEWKRIRFYAAAGAMTEVNVAGKQVAKVFVESNEIRHEKQHVRMKEWMWSVNARAGASYPLLRFLSVYAEVGAGYYFDNGSDIETIRSEKPFNVNLQAGFRLGF